MARPLLLALTVLLVLVAAAPVAAQEGAEGSSNAVRFSSELEQKQSRPEDPGITGQGSVQEEVVEEEVGSWVNWRSALYLFVLCLACVFLAALTGRWWVVPVLGVVGPLTPATRDRFAPELGVPSDRKTKDRELLEALAERGEITPATAAMRTSLTVDEAAEMLDDLARKGHLKLRAEDGIIAYSLPEHNRSPAPDGGSEPVEARAEGDASPEQPDDPLSVRELEVLALLSSGRTNAEISEDLCVAVGTVKSHLNSIYRKLGAANRAEAVAKAQRLNLLR